MLMAMWGTKAYGQDQASSAYPAPAGSTQPAKPHYYSLGGGGIPLNGARSKHLPPPPGCHLAKFGTLPVEMIGLRAMVPATVNGRSTHFILDTGAFFSMMSGASAASLGVEPVPATKNLKLVGIGGDVKAQQAFVDDLHIPGLSLDNAAFVIGGTDAGNALLGANLLDQNDLEIDLAHGKVTLFGESQCDNALLAYWAKESHVVKLDPSQNPFDRRTFLAVTINGTTLRALLDSGAPSTVISRSAAERAGIDLKTADGKTGAASGIGAKSIKQWEVSVDAVSVGTETIQHTEMLVIDGSIAKGTDMLLGADFLLAHHVYISNIQNKAYFTYNGGRVFNHATTAAAGDTFDGGVAAANDGNPKSAADYFLRGQGHLSRDELKDALADLNKAIALSPGQSTYYVARARAYAADKRPDAALADLDSSLSINPKNSDALLMRAETRLSRHDREGAASDVKALSTMLPSGSMQAQAVAAIDINLGEPMAALPLLDGWIVVHDNDAMLGHVLGERCLARALSNQVLGDALKDCHDAIRRDGKKPEYLESLGLVEWRLGHYSDSIKAYKQALDEAPNSAWSRYGLGVAEIRDGRQDEGNADLNAARALDPHIDERAAKYGLTATVR
jgi:predicted aspartyl protease/tetratricopeptide (TPR) repeat protein